MVCKIEFSDEAFKEFGKIAIIGQEQNGTNYAVAVVICKHEKKISEKELEL